MASKQPTARAMPTCFHCHNCGPHMAVDEDGACEQCGNDATVETCRCSELANAEAIKLAKIEGVALLAHDADVYTCEKAIRLVLKIVDGTERDVAQEVSNGK